MRQQAETSCQSTTAWRKVRARVQRLSHIAGRVCVSACCQLVNMHMTPDLHNLIQTINFGERISRGKVIYRYRR